MATSHADQPPPDADDDIRERIERILDATRSADDLAQAVIERVDALHERCAVVQASALQDLLATLSASHLDLSEGLEREAGHAQEAAQQAQAASEESTSEAASAVDSLSKELDHLSQQIADEVAATSTCLATQLHARLDRHAGLVQSSLDASLARAKDGWARSESELLRGVEDLLRRTGESLSGAQSESLETSLAGLHRISQLKSEVDDCARGLASIIGTFSGLMGSTRTGLNVTAGTLSDVVSVFQEVT